METKAHVGLISSLGTLGIIIAIAWNSNTFTIVFSDLINLLTGGVGSIAHFEGDVITMLCIIAAVIALELPVSVISGIMSFGATGKANGEHAVAESVKAFTHSKLFFKFFLITLAEEVIARWFFLGFLPKLSFLSGTFAFYLLFFIGNGLWAIIHLTNFSDKKDHQILRVLPQFVSGLFFTYVFVKFGLFAAILTHFATNAILFSVDKRQNTNVIDMLIVLYGGICAGLSYWLMKKPLTDLLAWSSADLTNFQIVGWGFFDYLWANLFISSIFMILFGCLLYDRGSTDASLDKRRKKEKNELQIGHIIIGTPILIAVVLGNIALVCHMLGIVIKDVSVCTLTIAILITFMQKGASGSAMSRTFFSALPTTVLMLCTLHALGFFPSIALLLIRLIIAIPHAVLISLDD